MGTPHPPQAVTLPLGRQRGKEYKIMALPTTVWWDKNGSQHTGYIKDGKTFVDENAQARVPVGATVQTAGGTFKMTDNGGVPTAATARNQFLQGTDAAINAYKAAGQIQNDRINSATNAAIAELNRQKNLAKTNMKDANKAAKEAYRQAANPFGALEEQRVRLGLDESGYAESSKLKLASAYAAQVNENQRAMNDQLRDIDVQIAQAKASGQYELANMLEARAQNIMQNQIAKLNTLYSTDMQAMNMAENTRQFNDQMDLKRESMAREEAIEKEQNKYNLALTFLENGMDSEFVINTLGIPAEDVSAMASQIRNQRAQEAALAMAKATRSGSSGGGRETSKNTNDVLATMLSFNDDSKARAYLLTLNKFDEAERDEMMELYDATKEATGRTATPKVEGTNTPANPNTSALGSKYGVVLATAASNQVKGKSKEQIVAYLDSISPAELTDAGYMQIVRTLFKDER